MDFLERLQKLMNDFGMKNKAELAAKSGIPLNTVYSWWKKGWEGITLPNLRKLCDCFHCSLDWLVFGKDIKGNSDYFTPDEMKVINAYRVADERAQVDALSTLISHPRIQKEVNLA